MRGRVSDELAVDEESKLCVVVAGRDQATTLPTPFMKVRMHWSLHALASLLGVLDRGRAVTVVVSHPG